MFKYMLLPHSCKTIGWVLLIPSAIAGILATAWSYELSSLGVKSFTILYSEPFDVVRWFSMADVNLTSTLIGVLFIAGALMVGFSKEKQEDEFINGLRLSSLLWAVCLNYLLLLLAFLFVYGLAFLSVMLYNMFTVLVIFIIRFNYLLYKSRKTIPDEKHH